MVGSMKAMHHCEGNGIELPGERRETPRNIDTNYDEEDLKVIHVVALQWEESDEEEIIWHGATRRHIENYNDNLSVHVKAAQWKEKMKRRLSGLMEE